LDSESDTLSITWSDEDEIRRCGFSAGTESRSARRAEVFGGGAKTAAAHATSARVNRR
jgi:hypothetical protein